MTTKWTSEMDDLLGIVSDEKVADRLGLTRGIVRRRRKKLGVPPSNTTKWSTEMDTLLGTMFDLQVADRLGLARGTVLRRRQKLGIPALGLNLGSLWSTEKEALLGTMPDRKLALKLHFPLYFVSDRRHQLGIPSWRDQNRLTPSGIAGSSREGRRFCQSRRRHKKVDLPDTLTYKQWKDACKYFKHRCAYCGQKCFIFLTEDHLVPLSKGGPRTVSNILPACQICNTSKGNKQAYLWIHKKFGREKGKRITNNILEYLTSVKKKSPKLCVRLDARISDVAEANLKHLADRKARNVIKGGGDNR